MFSITTQPSCPWTITGAPNWLYLSRTSGTGTALPWVDFTVLHNTGPPRSATLNIAGQTITIQQAGSNTGGTACTTTPSPSQSSFSAAGGSGVIQITSSQPDCAWTISGAPAWLTLPQVSGSGTQTVNFTIAANTRPAAREAVLTIAGATVVLTQAAAAIACGFTVTTSQSSFPASVSSTAVQINATASSCSWTSSGVPSWITLSSTGGIGSELVTLTIAGNTGAERSATFTIAGQEIFLTQAASQASILPPVTTGVFSRREELVV